MSKKIVVTGGNGAAGSYVIQTHHGLEPGIRACDHVVQVSATTQQAVLNAPPSLW